MAKKRVIVKKLPIVETLGKGLWGWSLVNGIEGVVVRLWYFISLRMNGDGFSSLCTGVVSWQAAAMSSVRIRQGL